jgi:hypothetical protein
MSGFLLDTNVPSELTKPEPESRVRDWVNAPTNGSLYLLCFRKAGGERSWNSGLNSNPFPCLAAESRQSLKARVTAGAS